MACIRSKLSNKSVVLVTHKGHSAPLLPVLCSMFALRSVLVLLVVSVLAAQRGLALEWTWISGTNGTGMEANVPGPRERFGFAAGPNGEAFVLGGTTSGAGTVVQCVSLLVILSD
jgi:hypothetical protein